MTRAPIAAVALWLGWIAACDDRSAAPVPAPPPIAEPRPEVATAVAPPIRSDGTVFGESELMGTRISINVYVGPQGDSVAAGAAMEAALAEMARIESIMSEWQPQTELSRLSLAAGQAALAISPELLEVLERSKRISEATDGTFDVTFHAVGQLWKFHGGAQPPTREQVRRKLPLIDWRQIELDRAAGTARLARPGMMVGLGAIAKGYAVDRATSVLRAAGFRDHVVEAGGDTYASGTKAGTPWMVGVQNPDAPGTVGVLPTSDRAVVTSGDYQRYFDYEGKRYSHILDPKTGWPIEVTKSPKSVTLVASNATDADAYCTAVTVMGTSAGLAFVERETDLEVIIIDRDDHITVSSGLEATFIRTPARPERDQPQP